VLLEPRAKRPCFPVGVALPAPWRQYRHGRPTASGTPVPRGNAVFRHLRCRRNTGRGLPLESLSCPT
jgi:hypothetical protein